MMKPGKARRPMPKIERYEAMDSANTIARAREHLGNPKMMSAIKQHVSALNAAVNGGLKPKKPRI